MKIVTLLVTAFAAFLPASAHAQEPSLASVMDRFTKEPTCIGSEFMAVTFALVVNESFDFRAMSSNTVDVKCLKRKRLSGLAFPPGSARDGSYFEFNIKSDANVRPLAQVEGGDVAFELTLGQPENGSTKLGRPRLGILDIKFSSGSRRFLLPDSLTIATDASGLNQLIYGEIVEVSPRLPSVRVEPPPGNQVKAVISIAISNCTLESCGPINSPAR